MHVLAIELRTTSPIDPWEKHRSSWGGSALIKAVTFALVFSGLSGCHATHEYFKNGLKVGPNYRRPPAAVSNQWVDSEDTRVKSVHEDDSTWWTAFNDPILASLVYKAYHQNLPLKEAAFRVLAARAQFGFAIGNLLPQQQQGYAGYSRRSISETVANHEFTPAKFFDYWDGGFNLAWEIDLWGRYRRSILAAEAQLDATVEDYDAILVTLVSDVASQYITIRAREWEIYYLKKNVELSEKALEIAKDRFEGGAVGEVDVEQAKTLMYSIEAFIPPLEKDRRQAANRLCVLLGIPVENLVKEIGPGPLPIPAEDVALGIPADLLRRRPDVRRAERLMAAQSEQIGIATAELYPQLFINGTIGVASTPFRSLFDQKSFVGGIGPAVRWNLFNYGRLVNQIRVQDAAFQELAARYRNTVLVANQEVENGIISFLQSQEQARVQAEAVKAAQKSVELAIDMYQDGRVDLTRYFVMARQLALLQREYVKSLGDIGLSLIDIHRALGGGWQIRLPQHQGIQTAAGSPPVVPPPATGPSPFSPTSPDAASSTKPAGKPDEGNKPLIENTLPKPLDLPDLKLPTPRSKPRSESASKKPGPALPQTGEST